ncbi:hypothetical protein ACLQ2R_28005 [Streptosporangium sp. DT93]|uniref:hypothetical protein n=1 Tax=Streptosporangium sp. DT93 TaxID=3393428 RepID=UPI003CF776F4
MIFAVSLSGAPAASAGTSAAHCARLERVAVPGAEHQVKACLDDLTTAGTTVSGHTVPAHWAGLHPAGAVNPKGVPGIQVDGYHRITDGTHVDSLYAAYPDRLRPLLPCFRSAFETLEGWVERRQSPPPSATLPRPATGDLPNECRLSV